MWLRKESFSFAFVVEFLSAYVVVARYLVHTSILIYYMSFFMVVYKQPIVSGDLGGAFKGRMIFSIYM